SLSRVVTMSCSRSSAVTTSAHSRATRLLACRMSGKIAVMLTVVFLLVSLVVKRAKLDTLARLARAGPCPARLAVHPPIPTDNRCSVAPALELRTPALRAPIAPVKIHVRVIRDPRKQSLVQLDQQVHVLFVVLPEPLPRLSVALHHLEPQSEALVCDLSSNSELVRDEIKLVTNELELLLDYSE